MAHHLQHSGRGGAGNKSERSVEDANTDDPAQNPHAQAEFPPELHGPYSTGRGGAANMKKNDAGPHVARIAQDLEGDDRVGRDSGLLDAAQYSGRGGVGNIAAARKSQELSRSREGTPRSSGAQTPAASQPPNQAAKVQHEGLADRLKHALHHTSHGKH